MKVRREMAEWRVTSAKSGTCVTREPFPTYRAFPASLACLT
jgi:hypothetical protein